MSDEHQYMGAQPSKNFTEDERRAFEFACRTLRAFFPAGFVVAVVKVMEREDANDIAEHQIGGAMPTEYMRAMVESLRLTCDRAERAQAMGATPEGYRHD